MANYWNYFIVGYCNDVVAFTVTKKLIIESDKGACDILLFKEYL